ncbi:type III secretion system outer membrane ring subunit SctC [Caballeronia mineralivorans]|jgi:type III secretion protein C|uniref:type III secretion system outer membrane ring subunit SctC n=1 Tax=Caballeronia mineralivorans TaxID=2010198 RepID=UPI0023F47ABD|nr:type III secretion system outer membrane ring subunit SctC [Caballeronia mineralivorans]MDB5786998.1 EscC/YscC/HrcC family type secretion system outer rane ring protein [Caballeronia mineralivorans]MEA3098935.1 type secretion protein [Caballeronia mineralivorans]
MPFDSRRHSRVALFAAYLKFSLCLALVLGDGGRLAFAAQVPFRTSTVHIAVEGKDLKDVLRDFSASQGIAASVASDVQGAVSGHFDMSPQRFLDTLASTFGFVWFYDGSVLAISSANDVTRQVIQLDFAGTRELKATLSQMGLENKRFPVVYDPSMGAALVTGPSQYVALVANLASRLDQNANRRVGTEVRVFPLKHGWADDHNVVIDGKSVTVPGVARVMAGMYHPGKDDSGDNTDGGGANMAPGMERQTPMTDAGGGTGGGSPFASGDSGGVNPPLPAFFGRGGAPQFAGRQPGYAQGRGGGFANGNDIAYGGGTGAVPAGAGSLPVIKADPRTNSVLIRDLPQRIGQYQTLINQLDVRRRLVEIEAHIIEIDDTALQQIGVDWRAHNSHIDIQTGNGTTGANSYANGQLNPTFTSTDSSGNTVINTTPGGLSLTAVLGDAGRYLLARVNALEDNNLARIDASPKVATLDNVEAVMDNKKKFYVRVQGYTSGDLYAISTGTSLRVLPMVVDESGRTQIKLQVHVEDGQTTAQQVDNIPVITTSTINTEAVVSQGESLLIAGYRVDNTSNGESGIPVLSKIPLLGGLFRYRENSHSHMERLVLLSPRVIEF